MAAVNCALPHGELPLGEGRVCIVLGDVSGKGIPAALFMAVTSTLLRATARHVQGPAEILSHVNQELARDNESSMFVTLFCGVLDTKSGLVTWASGGHTAPVLLRPGHAPSLLAGRPQVPAGPLTWLNELRAHAVDRVGVLSVPNTRDEEWRFTDISPLTKISFQPARSPARLTAADIESFVLPEAAARLTFVDGIYAPHLSFNAAGIVIENMAAGLAGNGASMQMHLGQHANVEVRVFNPFPGGRFATWTRFVASASRLS